MSLRVSRTTAWFILVPAMTLPFFASIFYFVLFSGHPIAQLLYSLTKLFTLAWPFLGTYIFVRAWLPSLRFGDPRHRRAIPLGLATGFAIVLIMLIGLVSPIGNVLEENSPRILAKLNELNISRYYVWFSVFLAFFHSLLEEYYWRYFVYGHLRLLVPHGVANLLSACAFASHHVVILREYFPFSWALFFGGSVAIGGILWNFMYERQRTLVGAWVSHMLVDIGLLSIGYIYLF